MPSITGTGYQNTWVFLSLTKELMIVIDKFEYSLYPLCLQKIGHWATPSEMLDQPSNPSTSGVFGLLIHRLKNQHGANLRALGLRLIS